MESTKPDYPCPLCDVFPWETPLELVEHALSAHTLNDVARVRALGTIPAPERQPDGWIQVPSINGGTTTRRIRDEDLLNDEDRVTLRDLLKRLEGNENAEAIRALANIGKSAGTLRHGLVQGWIKELRALLPDPAAVPEVPVEDVHWHRNPFPTSSSIPNIPPGEYELNEGKFGTNLYKVSKGRSRTFVKKFRGGDWTEMTNAAQVAVLHRIHEAGIATARVR